MVALTVVILFSAVTSEHGDWYVKLDCKNDNMTSSSTCGRSSKQACCQLQDVLNNIQEGGTLLVFQHPTSKQSKCDKREEIQVEVTKSFTLKTLPPEERPGVNSTDRGHLRGVQIMFNGNCSEQCSLTISESQFSCTWIGFNNLDIRIEDTHFMDGFITAQVQSDNHGNGFNMKIHDSEFKNSFPIKIGSEKTSMNNETCKQLNYVCLSGYWNAVEIVRSNLEGDRQSQVSGVEVMHANIQTLNLVDDQISFMFSAVVIQVSGVGMFNISDCIFVGNRDGIDIGEGVRYMIVSRSQMNNTGSGRGYALKTCSSALKGTVQNLEVKESIFAQNQVSGKACKGAALYLRTNVSDISLLKSYNSGGAVTVYGAKILIQIVGSIFLRNKASKGAALYIDVSDKGLMGFPQNKSTGNVTSTNIILYSCTFTENIAEFGGGLMTELTESTLDSGGHISTLIYDCSFIRNKATSRGAGAYLNYFNVSIKDGAAITIQTINTDFKENNSTGSGGHLVWGYGGGISMELSSFTLMSSASVKTMVDNCSFTSNTASWGGGGIHTEISSCSVDSHSSIILQTTDSVFMSNTATDGAAIKAVMKSCSVVSKSSITLHTIGSTFSSNIVEYNGAGIGIELDKCSVDFNSSIKLVTIDSTFISNTAKYNGAGIGIQMNYCTVYSHSSIKLVTIDSSFISNTATRHGAGIYTKLLLSKFNSEPEVAFNSSITIQTIGSTFTSNIVKYDGAGIYTRLYGCTLSSGSSITFETIHSIFLSQVAEKNGAGISMETEWMSIHPSSFLTVQAINSSFKSCRTKVGAGLFLRHSPRNPCVSGQVAVAIIDSRFQNNSASREGGSLYLNVFQVTQVYISQTEFESNRALPGSGLYRENTHFQTCDAHCDTKSQVEVTTHITQCHFINNIDTGIVVKDKGRYGSVAITKCSFRNNRCIDSSFAEDIFSEIDLELTDTNILKTNNHQRQTGINTQSDTKLKNVTVNIGGASNQQQFSIALFSHYITLIENVDYEYGKPECITLTNSPSLRGGPIFRTGFSILSAKGFLGPHPPTPKSFQRGKKTRPGFKDPPTHLNPFAERIEKPVRKIGPPLNYQCPAFYQPKLSTAGLTDTGAAMVRATCDSCFKGYYTGQTWMAVSAQNNSEYTCQEKNIVDEWGDIIGKNNFCYTKSVGTCFDCPHGANCTAGVVSLPNYWGHKTTANRLEFHRCPVGYCCNQAPCQDIDQCATHRVGTLCGRCMEGFTESLITPECIPNQACSHWWIFHLFCFWAFAITLVILFTQDIVQMKEMIRMRLQKCKSIPEHANKVPSDALNGIELKRIDSVEIHRPNFLALKCDSSKHKVKRRHSIEIQPIHHVVSSSTASKIQSTCMQCEVQNSECSVKVPILRRLLSIERQGNVQASGSHKYLQIMLYFLQDAAIMQIDLALVSTVITPIQKLRELLIDVSQFAVDLIDFGLNLCPFPGWTPVTKLLTKSLTGPFVFSYIFAIYGIVQLVCHCFPNKRKHLRDYWYPRLTSATIFSILLFYQQIASVTFSLLYCIKSGDHLILFRDGNVTCYQPWQILVFIFAFNWIVGIIPVLMFLPGLLELRLIRVSHFILACMMPVPMLLYWLFRFYRQKLRILSTKESIQPWHKEILKILQTTFVKTTDRRGLPFCWIGFMKIRRLALVLLFTFVSNLVARVSLMCLIIMLFLLFHLKTEPYQDDLANNLYTGSLLATLVIGFINIMKASCVEFYLDLNKVAHYLTTLNMMTDAILVYCPLAFVALTIVVTLVSKVKQIFLKKKDLNKAKWLE